MEIFSIGISVIALVASFWRYSLEERRTFTPGKNINSRLLDQGLNLYELSFSSHGIPLIEVIITPHIGMEEMPKFKVSAVDEKGVNFQMQITDPSKTWFKLQAIEPRGTWPLVEMWLPFPLTGVDIEHDSPITRQFKYQNARPKWFIRMISRFPFTKVGPLNSPRKISYFMKTHKIWKELRKDQNRVQLVREFKKVKKLKYSKES